MSDDEPGYRRLKWGQGFTFRDLEGETIPRGSDERERLEDLAIPPAWTEVWICPDPNGHLLVTGRDDQGRKQYIYHPAWRRARHAVKYHRLLRFGWALPDLRSRLEEDLAREDLSREKVLALVVRLLQSTCIRIGNEKYRRENGSFGLTTLRNRHLQSSSSRIRFAFPGKGGDEIVVDVEDDDLVRLIRECRDAGEEELFQYVDGEGNTRPIRSEDVNDYLHAIADEEFTAKDVRTWMGTVHALVALREIGPAEGSGEADRNVIEAIDRVAERLRNTRSVCRDAYVHPGLLESYREGWLFDVPEDGSGDRSDGSSSSGEASAKRHLDPAELDLLAILEEYHRRAASS